MTCELVAPVFQKYEQELLNFIKKRLKDPVESEEVLNQVLMKVIATVKSFPQYATTGPGSTGLHGMP
jgi:DNA-directed RNA polymerase specialized sigma24 family protein